MLELGPESRLNLGNRSRKEGWNQKLEGWWEVGSSKAHENRIGTNEGLPHNALPLRVPPLKQSHQSSPDNTASDRRRSCPDTIDIVALMGLELLTWNRDLKERCVGVGPGT